MNNLLSSRNLMYLIVVLIVGAVAWAVLTMPDQRSTGQKMGDAVDALPHGVDKAAEQLEDRTPGEKLGDAVRDAGDEIKNTTDR
jgi:short subunit fatty acids transporter